MLRLEIVYSFSAYQKKSSSQLLWEEIEMNVEGEREGEKNQQQQNKNPWAKTHRTPRDSEQVMLSEGGHLQQTEWKYLSHIF